MSGITQHDGLSCEFTRSGFIASDMRVDDQELGTLESVCNRLLDRPVDDGGNGRHRIGLGQNRRFLAHCHREFPELEQFVLAGSAARSAVKLLGGPCVLFNEQFVVKGPGTGAGFAWHQDSAYVGFDHEPYLSIWVAIDDATPDNGCLRLIPRNLAKDNRIDPHEWCEDGRELKGPAREDEAVRIVVPAGSMVAFSSLTMHSSGPNITPSPRRSYLVQYSRSPLRDPRSGQLKRFATPVMAG